MEDVLVEILLVEDNMNDADLTIRALKKNKAPYHLIHLQDGAKALDFVFGKGDYSDRDTSMHPKLILLDLKMPRVDGMDVLRRIKGDDKTKTIPIVVLTSSKEDPDIQKCYELGASSYIVKPVGYENFMKAIGELEAYWMQLNQSPK